MDTPTTGTAPRKMRVVRKVNRPPGQYPCPFEHGFVGFPSKDALADHIAREHRDEVVQRAAKLKADSAQTDAQTDVP